jgi:hypothetical protein
MSVDLAVWYEPAAVTDEQAAEKYERLRQGEDAGLIGHRNLSTFFVDLVSRFPTSDTALSRREIGAWVWSEDPELEDNGLLLSLSRASVREVAPKIRYMAERYGLVSYDPHAGQVQLPRPLAFPMLQLSGDELPSVIEPSTEAITDAIAGLGEEHVYLTLQRFAQEYVQVAARTTADILTVEYRDGTPELHYQINTRELAVVENVFLGFTHDDEWKLRYRWRRVP